MAQPTRSKNKPTAAGTAHHADGLHYSKQDLHADYTQTYKAFMAALAVGIVGALVYFFGMIIYLGAKGHTPTDDYVREFGSRIQYEYKGLRLPEYDNPELVAPKAEGKVH